MGETVGVVLAVAVLFPIAGALAYPASAVGGGMRLLGWASGLSGRARESARLRIAAVLLDIGNYLMLCDEVTLEIPVGAREQEGNPTRTLAISCVVHYPPKGEYPVAQDGDRTLSWRVINRPSPGYRGTSTMCEVPSLERALLAYHARPLRPLEQGGRFFDEDVHHGAGDPEATG